MKTILKNKKYGFTLIETIFAIAILLLVITGPLALSSQSLKAASAAKDNFIAANLAQEGIELIRSYRINNVIQDEGWMNDLIDATPSCRVSPGCYLDAKTIKVTGSSRNFDAKHCPGSVCPPLQIDSNGQYNYSSGATSIFTRTIRLSELLNDKIVRVTVTITWNDKYGSQSLVVEEIMHNWFVKQ